MTDNIRLRVILKELNVSLQRVVHFLRTKNIEVNINTKIKPTVYQLLVNEFKEYKKENASRLKPSNYDSLIQEPSLENKQVSKTDISIKTQYKKLPGPVFTGDKIDLSQFEKKKSYYNASKKKRPRIISPVSTMRSGIENVRQHINSERVEKIKETFSKVPVKNLKYRKKKQTPKEDNKTLDSKPKKVLKIVEFITVNELASLMNVSSTQLITACISLGVMVTMNQRLDAEILTLVADEFGYSIDFVGEDIDKVLQEDPKENLHSRAPIITVMGHVDHGKTSFLDYVRNTKSCESGGITQHIGAYSVELKNGRCITFLDTPGHEAFTSMRARGTKITDIVIIVIASDSEVMPQTKEAINHAKVAGVPIIFALNKIDKPTANPDKIREQLANINLLVEEWGGQYQSQEISAKTGEGIEQLLDKVWLEAELLGLKANPNKMASGTIIESTLDKGRGYMTTILVQSGTIKLGDYILAGIYHGKVKALFDERGNSIKNAGPSKPVSILGLNGGPTAGDKFKVFSNDKEAKQLALKKQQLQREHHIRTHKHVTNVAGKGKEIKIILKGDVDGSVEALMNALKNLSKKEVLVNIIHKGVGQITESDVLLASASHSIIIGFNVRTAPNARKIAEREHIEIRTYSIIYDVIREISNVIEGMYSPKLQEKICGTAEIRNLFNIPKIGGTVAGCLVINGKIFRPAKIKLIRDGIVIFHGELASLKRFKEDVKEVSKGYECGLQIKNYNALKIGDFIEVYEDQSLPNK
ncbi:MAG: translation initiation factor IF-2 [Candidatus Walczuchella monophlebidarum]